MVDNPDPVYTVSNSGGVFRNGVFRAGPSKASTSKAVAVKVQTIDPVPGYDRVSGPERAKFFKRPVLPHLQAERPEVLLAPPVQVPQFSNNASEFARHARMDDGEDEDEVMDINAATRSVGVQTVFRDSEAQTDPYTPDYTISKSAKANGRTPEVATLAGLTHAAGQLPIGPAELELIARNRQKRAFEAALPPMTDEASFVLRKAMLEAQETREWAYREAEIDALHEQRIELLRQALAARDQEHTFLAEQRVDALRQQLVHANENAREKIQQERVTALRKLTKKRQHGHATSPRRSRKRDLIAEYADFGSKVYAPTTREGKAGGGSGGGATASPMRDAGIEKPAFQQLDALRELESAVPARLLAPSKLKPSEKSSRTAKDRKQATIEAHLLHMEALIKNKERQAEEDAAALAAAAGSGPGVNASQSPTSRKFFQQQQQHAIVRPPTPDYALPTADEEDEEVAAATRLLQQLLRGRAVQNMMFEGRERRAELIAELRASDEAQRLAEQGQVPEDYQASGQDPGTLVARSTRSRAEGEVVSELLDFLSKELARATEVARLRAFVGAAVETRRTREVEEGGRRQAEELARAREDEVFRALQRVHLETSGDMIEDVVVAVLAAEAHSQALGELSVRRDGGIERCIAQLEQEFNSDEVIVKELVASFLVPQVQRAQVREQVAAEQRKFVTAAHAVLTEAVAGATSAPKDETK